MSSRLNSRIVAIFGVAAVFVGAGDPPLRAQTVQSEPLVVTGEEVPSSYGATPGFSRSRFSNLTQAYVLPPGAVFAGLIYQGDAQAFLMEHKPLPDAVEMRFLFAQDFSNNVEWAANIFVEQEIGGDRGREVGFAQSIMFPILLPNERLKVGAEMQYTSFTDSGLRDEGASSPRVIIGPTVAWKPTKNTRLDVSPLFGVTDDAPRASVFVVFSMLFGGAEREQAEAPASTRNR